MAQQKRQSVLEVSDDAKALLGTVFQMGCALTFQMIESRPTQRVDDALRELLEARVIVKENGPLRGDGTCAVTYRARIPTNIYRRFASKGNFIIAEPNT